jgi:hypothetical protein
VGEFRRGDLLDRAFLIGMVLKGLDGVLEVIGGLLRSGTQICVLVQRMSLERRVGVLRLTRVHGVPGDNDVRRRHEASSHIRRHQERQHP